MCCIFSTPQQRNEMTHDMVHVTHFQDRLCTLHRHLKADLDSGKRTHPSFHSLPVWTLGSRLCSSWNVALWSGKYRMKKLSEANSRSYGTCQKLLCSSHFRRVNMHSPADPWHAVQAVLWTITHLGAHKSCFWIEFQSISRPVPVKGWKVHCSTLSLHSNSPNPMTFTQHAFPVKSMQKLSVKKTSNDSNS